MSVSTKDLQIARRNAKRTRASKACVRCRSSKTQCSDYRPCKRCKNTGLGRSCIENDTDECVAYQFVNPCPTPSPACEMKSISHEANATSMGTKGYIQESSQRNKPESVPHPIELVPAAQASHLSFTMSGSANGDLQQALGRSVRLATNISMPDVNNVQRPYPPLSASISAALLSALPSTRHGTAYFSGTPNILDSIPNQNTNFHAPSAPFIPTTLLGQQAASQRAFQSPSDLLAIDRLRLLLALTTSVPSHPALPSFSRGVLLHGPEGAVPREGPVPWLLSHAGTAWPR